MDNVKLKSVTEQVICLNSFGKIFQPGEAVFVERNQAVLDSEVQECIGKGLLAIEELEPLPEPTLPPVTQPSLVVEQPELQVSDVASEVSDDQDKQQTTVSAQTEERSEDAERSAAIFAIPNGEIAKAPMQKLSDQDIPDFVPEEDIVYVGDSKPVDDGSISWVGDVLPETETLSGEPAELVFEGGTVRERV